MRAVGVAHEHRTGLWGCWLVAVVGVWVGSGLVEVGFGPAEVDSGLAEVDAGLAESVVFELYIVVIVDVVEAHDGVAFGKQGVGQVESDESVGTGYKCFWCV